MKHAPLVVLLMACGTAGTAGPTGPTGSTGAPGIAGTDGVDGADGADGSVGPTGPTGEDGQDGASAADLYERTIIVGPSDNLAAAVAGIAGASYTNQYVVHLEPGSYDVGATTLVLPAFVHIEGAGMGVSRIVGAVDGAILSIGGRTHVRDLSVDNSGTATSVFGIAVTNANAMDSPAVIERVGSHTTATMSGDSLAVTAQHGVTIVDSSLEAEGGNEAGNMIGMETSDATQLVMQRCTIRAAGGSYAGGLSVSGTGSAKVSDTDIVVSGSDVQGASIGVFTEIERSTIQTTSTGDDTVLVILEGSGEARIYQSRLQGQDIGIRQGVDGGPVWLAHSELSAQTAIDMEGNDFVVMYTQIVGSLTGNAPTCSFVTGPGFAPLDCSP